MTDALNTLITVAVLGVILFGIIPFGPDWWRNLRNHEQDKTSP